MPTRHPHTGLRNARYLRSMMSVDEHQQFRVLLSGKHRHRRCVHRFRRGSRPEGHARQRGQVRVFPFLVAGGRELRRIQCRRTTTAHGVKGRRAESVQCRRGIRCDLHHIILEIVHHAAASSDTTQSYPRASNSNASSLPPLITMRPLASTWTKSGTMYSSSR